MTLNTEFEKLYLLLRDSRDLVFVDLNNKYLNN